jgi:hypothetical protein
MNVCKVPMLLLFAAVLSVAVLPQGAAAATDVFRFKGQSALAFFESVDETGCVYTFVAVGGSADQRREGSEATASSWAFVSVDQYDSCTNTFVFSAYNEARDARVDINSALTTGSVVATIDLYDYRTGVTTTMAVDVAWTGTGDVFRSTWRESTDGPTIKHIFSGKGTSRVSTAMGSISDGATEYLSGPSTDAALRKLTSGELIIQR